MAHHSARKPWRGGNPREADYTRDATLLLDQLCVLFPLSSRTALRGSGLLDGGAGPALAHFHFAPRMQHRLVFSLRDLLKNGVV